MRPPQTRRLVVGAGACLGLATLVGVPASGYSPTPLVGGVPAGPFSARPSNPRPPAPPAPRVPTDDAPTSAGPVSPPAASTAPTWTSTAGSPLDDEPPLHVPEEVSTAPAPGPSQPAPVTAAGGVPEESVEPGRGASRPVITPVAATSHAATPSHSPTPAAGSPSGSSTPGGRGALERAVPQLVVDDLNEVCNTDRTGFSVRWSAVPGADHYTVRASGAGLSTVVMTGELSQRFACPTATGSVRFTVVAKDATGVRESEPGTVSRQYAEPLGGAGVRVALTGP